jgi:hypothetical protein
MIRLSRAAAVLAVAVGVLAAGCAAPAAPRAAGIGPMPAGPVAARSAFSLDTVTAPVAALYRFAESRQAVFEQIPCYCNCGGLGHRSLRDCFVRRDGGYEAHASVCGVCLAEAIDIQRMLGEGKDVAAIRATIDATYGGAGR